MPGHGSWAALKLPDFAQSVRENSCDRMLDFGFVSVARYFDYSTWRGVVPPWNDASRFPPGQVAEWSNAPDSKSGIRFSRIVSSNLTLSARS